jgi:hypothetical protein
MSDRAIELFVEAYKTKLTPEYQKTVLDQIIDIYLEARGKGIIYCSVGFNPVEALKSVVNHSLNEMPLGASFAFFLSAIEDFSEESVKVLENLSDASSEMSEVLGKLRQVHTIAVEVNEIMAYAGVKQMEQTIADVIRNSQGEKC